MVRTVTRKTKRKAKERPTYAQPIGTKEGRKLVPLVVGSYFTHNPFNVTCMELWDLKIIGGLKQTSYAKAIFFSIAKAKTCWKVILICSMKNRMQKDKNKWPPDRLSWKRRTHSLMKQSISHPGAPCTSIAIRIWCFSWNFLYLWILTIALSSTTTLIGQLMTIIPSFSMSGQ